MMQILVNGLVTGLAVAVTALAFATVYVPTRVFHIALGGVYVVTPFVVLESVRLGMPWFLAALTGLAVAGALSVLLEVLNHWSLERRGASPSAHFVSSLGLYIVISECVVLIWGSEAQVLRSGISPTIDVGPFALTQAQLLSGLISLVALSLFFGWYRLTTVGLQLRALAESPVRVGLLGHDVRRLRLIAFLVSGILCGVAALGASYDVGFDPHQGMAVLLLAVVSAIVGGRDSPYGPVLGGLMVGLLRTGATWLWSGQWADLATFLLVAIALYIRPGGVLGRQYRLEASA